jgi:hypothetical protein
MSYPWDEIKEVVERIENERVLHELSLLEEQEGFIKRQIIITERTRSYLEFLGELSIGLGIGIFSIIVNYIFFVWLLHLEF